MDARPFERDIRTLLFIQTPITSLSKTRGAPPPVLSLFSMSMFSSNRRPAGADPTYGIVPAQIPCPRKLGTKNRLTSMELELRTTKAAGTEEATWIKAVGKCENEAVPPAAPSPRM